MSATQRFGGWKHLLGSRFEAEQRLVGEMELNWVVNCEHDVELWDHDRLWTICASKTIELPVYFFLNTPPFQHTRFHWNMLWLSIATFQTWTWQAHVQIPELTFSRRQWPTTLSCSLIGIPWGHRQWASQDQSLERKISCTLHAELGYTNIVYKKAWRGEKQLSTHNRNMEW